MKKTEARYVIRLGHTGSARPEDCETLLGKVRERVRSLGGEAMNLRVSRKGIEFDLFCSPEKELHPYLNALETVGPTLTYKRLDIESPVGRPADVIAEARTLFNEERYWEAHEALEGIWKTAQGQEKQLIQGLILTAAALVHAQKNQWKVVRPMLEDAAARLEKQPATYYGLDVKKFLQHLKSTLHAQITYFPTI